jgi:hypothetical protein
MNTAARIARTERSEVRGNLVWIVRFMASVRSETMERILLDTWAETAARGMGHPEKRPVFVGKALI